MTLRILVLSFYYAPDLSAGSFRAEALVKSLQSELEGRAHIDVVTTRPNRYHSYRENAPRFEQNGPVSIHRVGLPLHRSGMFDQVAAFTTFARGALKIVKHQQYDLVLATSSRLMTAVLGAVIARRKARRLYLDIRDIFVDTLPELFPWHLGALAAWVFSPVERWTIRQASRVNLISPGFLPYFSRRYPELTFAQYTNGVDELFLKSRSPQQEGTQATQGRLKVVYAGNLGLGQGLHIILPSLAKRLEDRVEFHLVGAGGAADKLIRALDQHDVTNVRISPPMKREQLIGTYQDADVLFLHLNNLKAFRKVLPSKLFEYAATNKPIWAGLSGYPRRFTRQRIKNAAIFSPCDIEGAVEALDRLELQLTCRREFVEQYSRSFIKQRMAKDISKVMH
ncbi:glycosyltransferase involved in cell wall biosynthesis [Pseudomonas nitritireducens]|uniref:Glycosyltransferase involved in cell wall biosynthesis n=1 Tax=Pseudomonas nitroreducens TaxID=46680 RepID=A0A7W7P2U3_PSENT|nr:glycosyltransferase family 4 protein [Pseudomonas nitritireducens]MBB4865099.1 glycosyltransferase involved in cell wall biosynthesis [Pseudomonas nitritireducens]